MFEVLVFVYENYWRGDACPEWEHLERKLNAVGFDADEIHDALTWLSGLSLAAQGSQLVGDPHAIDTPPDGATPVVSAGGNPSTTQPASLSVALPGKRGHSLHKMVDAGVSANRLTHSSARHGAGHTATASATPPAVTAMSESSMRVYAIAEQDHLGGECLGFITFLESAGILPASMREIVVDRAMAAPGDPVGLDDLKIIILMVYWSLGKEPDALVLDELCDGTAGRLAH